MEADAAEILTVCLAVSFHAGEIIRQVLASGQLGVIQKGENDPCTLADTTAQRLIQATFRRYFPAFTVIGEENITLQGEDVGVEVDIENLAPGMRQLTQNAKLSVADTVIWVDPLDGTNAFVKGEYQCVTTLIGIAVSGKPLYGFIHRPFASPAETYWGGFGLGCRRTVSSTDFLGSVQPTIASSSISIVTSSSHSRPQDIQFLSAVGADRISQASGSGYKSLLVLKGEESAYVYPRTGMMKWDTCATEAILSALGGYCTDMEGRVMTYEKTAERANAAGPIFTLSPDLHSLVRSQYLSFISR